MSDLAPEIPWNIELPSQPTMQNPFQMTPISMDPLQAHATNNAAHNNNQNDFDSFAGLPANTGADDLFNFDVDVRFDLDGFWEDFTLGEGSGFPFR